jgi:hypothetical protein
MRDLNDEIPKEYIKFLGTDEVYSSRTPFEFILDGNKIYFGGKRDLGTQEEIDHLKQLSSDLVREENDSERKGRIIINWVFNNVEYRPQEFKHPTLSEIRKNGGTCEDKSILAMVMLRHIGIPVRFIIEAAICKPSAPREEMAKKIKYTIIGRYTNIHVWLELYLNGKWIPADPSFDICGEKEWVYTRLDWKKDLLGFVVPLMIFAEKGHGINSDMELRTSHYLIDMYSDFYPALNVHPYFESWEEKIEIFNTIAQHVPFREYNLWQYDKLFEEYLNMYLKIQKDINK